jgi:23S rRNA (cytidine1920-2'-O)/16S rRNA (cytidine1409-2'-O)-methyltransferase
MKDRVALLDLLCVRNPSSQRQDFFARILCGEIIVNGEKLRDPKVLVSRNAEITFQTQKYVSRGGVKLEHALNVMGFPVGGLVFIDAGSSTGGFTDCLLQANAMHVHAVDVGTNQLDYKLRIDGRISVHEKTNIMSIDRFDPEPHAAVADISFRSIRFAASHLLNLTRNKQLLALVKPQFEWIEPKKGFRGVVDDSKDLDKILCHLVADLRNENAFVTDVIESPITGRKGNREFFFLIANKEYVHENDILLKVKNSVAS